jgi:HK97 family phage portal protein
MGLTQPALRGDVVNYKQHDSVERIVLRSRRSWLERTVRSVKALASITFTRSQTWTFGSSGTTSSGGTIDYTERAGDGRGNAIVFSALDLLSTTFAQSPLQIKQIVGDQQNVVSNHELIRRMAKPNDYYSGKLLWKATIIDYSFGNAYWLKVRSGAGKPVQFFWVPSGLITPAWPSDDPTVFISHYDYNPNGTPIKVAVQDVVHFRNGMDPKNIRKGLSPLGALLREIATDEEAAEYVNTILRNLGVAGMVISPATDKGKISTPDAEKIKAQVMQRTSGDRRGEPLVIGGAVNVAAMGQDMSKLDVSALRHLPEERITAIFGTPAVLLGLGTGLENATFSNVDGLRRIFYENKVIPTQGFIASDVHTQLVPDFEANVDGFVVDFDNTDVRVLKEDENELVTRLLQEMEGGGMTLNEYRAERNREPVAEDMYMLSSRIIPVAVADIIKKATVADATQNTDGTGTGDTSGGGTGSGNGSGDGTGGGTGNDGNTNGGKSAVPATKDIGDSVTRIRARMNAQCRRDVQAFLTAQRDFVLAQVGDNKARVVVARRCVSTGHVCRKT